MKKVLKKSVQIFRIINRKHIGEYTANCAYFTILAFIPLLILILTLTKYTGIDEKILNLNNNFSYNNIINETVFQIIKEVYSKSVGTITISAIITLWSAGRGFAALCKGLYAIYNVKSKKIIMNFRIRGLICTIIFIFITVISLVLLVFGSFINNILQDKFNIFSKIITIFLKLKILLSILGLTTLFTFMYKFIPKHKYKIKYQIPGALFAAVTCNIISIFYSLYINIFTGFSITYGSLTALVLLMMWVYASMYCVLIGGMINNWICIKYKKM